MTKQSFSGNEIYSSLVMPNAYLNNAQILAKYILSNNGMYGGNGKNPISLKKYEDPIEEMLNPLLYNIKHGIELYCKTFLSLGENNFDKIHDIRILFCKFKCLCLELNIDKKTDIDCEELKEIESIIENLHNNDKQNDLYRYPNADSFLIYRKSKNTREEIKNFDQYTSIEWEIASKDENFSEKDYLKYEYQFSRKIPHICNEAERENKIECIKKIEGIVIKLWDFFEKTGKEKYFEERTKKTPLLKDKQ